MTGFLTHRGMIMKAESWNEWAPISLGRGAGGEGFLTQTQNTEYQKHTKI